MCVERVVPDLLDQMDSDQGYTWWQTRCEGCGSAYGGWGTSSGDVFEWQLLDVQWTMPLSTGAAPVASAVKA